MTYVVLSLSPSDVGFSYPLSQELVQQATRYIQDRLDSVVISYDDTATREKDLRRTHEPLRSSSWIIKYKGNKILITNQIAGEQSQQFKALYFGNGEGPICAKHTTRRKLKGWGDQWIESKQKFSAKDGHKNKPVPGTYGVEQAGMLKFYDKHTGMWMYRRCVKPISSSIIKDFGRDIRSAVFAGLEMARYEMYDRLDKDTFGANEPEDAGMSDMFTLEEMSYLDESKTKADQDLEDYRQRKLEDEQVTMDSQIAEQQLQERARGILVKAGLEAPKDSPAPKEKKSVFSRFKAAVTTVTETIADEWHKYFGVTR